MATQFASSVVNPTKEVMMTRSVEPVKIYEGQKHFWRTRQTLNVLIVEYPEHDCIEITAWWDPVNADAPTIRQALYVSASKAQSILVNREDIVKKIAEVESGSKWSVTNAAHEERIFKKTREAIASAIFSRIRLNDHPLTLSSCSADEQVSAAVESISLLSDEGKPFDFEISKPSALSSIADSLNKFKTRLSTIRSSSMSVEFDNTMNHFRQNVLEVNMKSREASRLSQVAGIIVDAMHKAQEAVLRNQSVVSVPRRRWKWAIHRVVLQNQVAKMAIQLSHMVFGSFPSQQRVAENTENEVVSTQYEREDEDKMDKKRPSSDNTSTCITSPQPSPSPSPSLVLRKRMVPTPASDQPHYATTTTTGTRASKQASPHRLTLECAASSAVHMLPPIMEAPGTATTLTPSASRDNRKHILSTSRSPNHSRPSSSRSTTSTASAATSARDHNSAAGSRASSRSPSSSRPASAQGAAAGGRKSRGSSFECLDKVAETKSNKGMVQVSVVTKTSFSSSAPPADVKIAFDEEEEEEDVVDETLARRFKKSGKEKEANADLRTAATIANHHDVGESSNNTVTMMMLSPSSSSTTIKDVLQGGGGGFDTTYTTTSGNTTSSLKKSSDYSKYAAATGSTKDRGSIKEVLHLPSLDGNQQLSSV